MENKKLRIKAETDSLVIGGLSISFERTLRIPDDDQVYPLPPSLGSFFIYKVEDYLDKVPEKWRELGGYFIGMYQREALWLNFSGSPHALIVDAGNINAITGNEKEDLLNDADQNYIVPPDQPWLDGFNAGEGFIRQFVAMPIGLGYTVEEQLSQTEALGGMRFVVFAPKPDIIPEYSPLLKSSVMECSLNDSMGLAAGGKMKQEIYPDEYGIDVWDSESKTEIYIHVANSQQFSEITGRNLMPSPVDADAYTNNGYPWFDLYNENKGDVKAAQKLSGVKSIKAVDEELGEISNEPSLNIPDSQIVTITGKKKV
ncbi:hypothetical protein JOC77_001441 [Peribacillus deserti]|uniref:Uncharacterized protein n=1 Tax=Peribacillus deserti TaxID=673318 RepID=A0ABS2QH23_9BACI|nr:hypothetical protein [Peribacillus deserti]MBM7692014.1 hypothetical protein [Peribacillus deserti]